ncbi:ABC transporter permease [Starkeya sp. ORNL1]|uniref:ABC transporter permease n=1 Tax=Starkeya sp. ORNL1 TaxID=2709380 RepID=UPI0014637B61|nr:ABC transporter permease [Starkeya sp. ORNL1]QJP14808.1 ABC transporter permease [Starkeya sp. ORNL1]
MSDRSEKRFSTPLLGVACCVIAIWLILPLTVIVPISFSAEDSFAFPPRSWTLDRYASLATPQWTQALFNSLAIAILVSLVCAVLGTLAAFGIIRSRSRLMELLRLLILAPQVVPIIIVGLGIYLVFLGWHITGTITGFVLAHATLALPFVVIPVAASLQTYDRSLERASASLGAGPLATFFQVTFPIIRPAILSGTILAFLGSFDELVLALFLQSPSLVTLPVLLYRRMTDTIDPTIAAVATIQLGFVIACVIAALAVERRRAAAADGKGVQEP